ncbi:hypothetical protein V9L05_24130 (plasmid) [Bernardetia sp. Wsw4-3y2]|uniref:hypothetical protein n=1 Tax=unclassified Bernardetia TaxID=2647129 RepID=UPI0030D12A5A
MKYIKYLIWLIIAIALGMAISYLYTGWPIIAVAIGIPSGIVTAVLFFLIDSKLTNLVKNTSLLFFVRLILMVILSIGVFALFSFFK